MVTNDEVGRRIRQAREALGLSQTELGRLLSRPRTHAAVSDIERGKTKLDVEELSELAVLLNRDLSYFYEVDPATDPPRATASVVYRRSERNLTSEQHREADRSIEAFKAHIREQAQRNRQEQDG